MEPLQFEIVSVEEAKQILDGTVPPEGAPDWSGKRRPVPPGQQVLSADAVKWLASLPPEARPLELCRAYPRIGNQLAALSVVPVALSDYLADLLIDKRGGRQGFPGGIAIELSQLQDHLLRSMRQP
jgi:hypothetical protein